MASYHITIKGQKYDRALYEKALESVQGQGDGRISKADAEQLLEKVLDVGPGQKDAYTETEKRTVRLLREQLQWTPAADEHFRGAIASVSALKGWETRLAGAGTPTPAPVAGDTPAPLDVKASITKVVGELGLPNMVVEIPEAEARGQLEEFGGAVGFEAALRAALKSFLEDQDDAESPREILCNAGFAARGSAELDALVRDYMNRPTTKLSLVHRGPFDRDNPATPYPPEHGESVEGNWAFLLRIDSLSDHLNWAIVDRAGAQPAYNYGFN